MGEKIKLNDYTAIQKSTAMLAALGFLINSMTASGEIIAGEAIKPTIDKDGNVTNIWAGEVNGENAFNHFKEFNQNANEIANMYFKQKDSTNEANRLFNFVDNQIKVEGTVNAIKNKKIGGELFFLSSSGMVVGNTGVINTGALYVMTPTQNAYDDALKEAELGNVYEGIVPKDGNVSIPLNPQGTIIVKGKINAVDRIELHAANITIGDKAEPIDANGNTVAVLATGITDFSNLVNTEGLDSGLTGEMLTAEKTKDGDIVLKASASAANVVDQLYTDYLNGTFGIVTDNIPKTVEAKVEVYGDIKAEKDVKISAEATNGNYLNTKNEGVEGAELEYYEGARKMGDIKASVEIGKGTIEGKDIEIDATVKNIYYDAALNPAGGGTTGNLTIGNNLGMVTPINFDAAFGILHGNADITIGENAALNASNDININAESVVEGTIGSTTAAKKIQFIQNAIFKGKGNWIPTSAVSVLENKSTSSININGDLNAKNDIKISSASSSALDINANNSTSKETSEAVTAFAIGLGENKSSLIIGDKSSIIAGNNIDIDSKADTEIISIANVAAGNSATLATAINWVDYSASSDIEINGNLESGKDIMIDSNTNIGENTITSNNKDGKKSWENTLQAIKDLPTDVAGQVAKNALSKFMPAGESGEKENTDKKKITESFSLGAAIALADEENSSSIKINGTVKAEENVNINSSVTVEDTNMTASGSAFSKTEDGKNTAMISTGVVYADIENNSSVEIESRDSSEKEILSGKDINLNSSVTVNYDRTAKMYSDLLLSVQVLKNTYGKLDTIPEQLKNNLNTLETKLNEVIESTKNLNGDNLFSTEFLEKAAAVGVAALDVQNSFNTIMADIEPKPTDLITNCMDILLAATQYTNLMNYANFSARSSASGKEELPSNMIAGSAVWTDLLNNSSVVIGRNVKISAENDFTVNSKVDAGATSIAGNFGALLPTAGTETTREGTSAGGSFSVQRADNTSLVAIAEGSFITAGDQIKITSENDIFNTGVSLSSGKGGKSLNGMVSYNQGESNSIISIDDEVTLKAEGKEEKAREENDEEKIKESIFLNAVNKTFSLNIAGAKASSEGGAAAVGAAAAITDYDINNKVLVADNDDAKFLGSENELFTGSVLEVVDSEISASSLKAEAETSGTINTISIAGGSASSKNENDEDGLIDGFKNQIKDTQKSINEGIASIKGMFEKDGGIQGAMNKNSAQGGGIEIGETQSAPNFAIAGAGSASVNLLDNNTTALIDGVDIKLNGGNIDVKAKDSAFQGAWSGAAALQWQKSKEGPGTTVALEGAVGVNVINNTISAGIKNSSVYDGTNINVNALGEGTQVAAGLGLAVSSSGEGSDTKNYQGGASVSVNDVNYNAIAEMDKVDVLNSSDKSGIKSDVDVKAALNGIQVTGGVNVQAGKTNGAAGSAVTVADIDNTVKAGITGGNLNSVNDVNVNGNIGVTQVTAAVAFGVSTNENGTVFEGAVSYNGLNNTINSYIDGTKITADGDIFVTATNTGETSENVTDSHKYLQDRGIDSTGKSYYIEKDDPAENKPEQTVLASKETDNEEDTAEKDNKDVSGQFDSQNNLDLENADKDRNVIVAAALSVAGGKGNALGASVSVADIDNNFTAEIKNAENITAKNINVNAESDTLLVSVGAGVAVGATKGFGGMGSVSWQDITNNMNSAIRNSTITADNIKVTAENGTMAVNVAGQVAFGKKAGIGAALGYNEFDNNTKAGIYESDITIANDIENKETNGVAVNAESSAEIYNIGFGTAASTGNVAINGTVALNFGSNNTQAIIGSENEEKTSQGRRTTIENADYINVTASDKSQLVAAVGSIAASKGVAVSGGVAYNEIKNTEGEKDKKEQQTLLAEINDTDITSEEGTAIGINALDNSRLVTTAIGVSGSGKVAVQGSAATAIVNKEVNALMRNTNIDIKKSKQNSSLYNTSVDIKADNNSEVYTGTLVAAGSGTAAVGAGVSVNQLTQNTNASVEGGEQYLKNLVVKSDSMANITNIGIGGSGSGTAAVTGSVAVNQLNNNTTVSINNAKINADGSIGIIAESDDIISNYAGSVAGAGTAAVGASVSYNEISGTTKAGVDNSTLVALGNDEGITTSSNIINTDMIESVIEKETAELDNNLDGKRKNETNKGIVIDSSSTHTAKALLVNAGLAGTAAVNGTVNINKIDGSTEANVTGNTILDAGQNDIHIKAGDYTNSSGIVGSASFAANAGVGAASDTNLVTRDVLTTVNNSTLRAKDIDIDAVAKQGLSSFGIGVGAAIEGAGVAATVSVTDLNGTTKVSIDNVDMTASENITVDADHYGIVSVAGGSLGGAAIGAGVGAGIALTKDENKTELEIKNSDLTAEKDINTNAVNETKLQTTVTAIGAAGLGAGVVGTVSLNNINSVVSTNILGGNLQSTKGNVLINSQNTIGTSLLSVGAAGGFVGAGATVAINTIDSGINTNILGAEITADKGKIEVYANEIRNIEEIGVNAAIGGVAVGGNVLINNFGTAVADDLVVYEGDGKKVTLKDNYNDINTAQDNKFDEKTAEILGQKGISEAGTKVTAEEGGNKNAGINVNITENSTLTANEITAEVKETDAINIVAGGGAGGVVSVSGTVAINNINRNLGVNIANSTLDATEKLAVKNTVTGTAGLEVYQGTGGLAALGAAYGEINATGNSLINITGSALSGNEVEILAKDSTKLEGKAQGLSVGVAVAGAIISEVSNSGEVKIQVENSNISGESILDITSEKANTVISNAVGGSTGILSGIGVTSSAKDSGTSQIIVLGSKDQLPSLKGTVINMQALNNMAVSAETGTVSISALAGVGASISEAEISGSAVVSAKDGAEIAGDNITIAANIGTVDGKVNTAEAVTDSVGGGGKADIGYNSAKVTNNSSSEITLEETEFNGKNSSGIKELNVLSTNNTKLKADIDSVSFGGIFAAGANTAEINNTGKSVIELSNNKETKVETLKVEGATISNNTLVSNGNGGGGIAGVGAAIVNNTINTTSKVDFGGNWNVSKLLKTTALDDSTVTISADSTRGGFVGANGITIKNNIVNGEATKVRIQDGTEISGSGEVNVESKNDIDVTIAASGAAYGGVGFADVVVENKVDKKTDIELGKVSIETDGKQDYQAFTDADIFIKNQIDAGGLAAVTVGKVVNTLNTSNKVSLADGANLETKKYNQNITFAASDKIKDIAEVIAETSGAGGGSKADVTSNLDRKNRVDINGDILSYNDVNLYAGRDKNGKDSSVNFRALAHAYTKAAIPVADPNLSTNISMGNQVATSGTSDIQSVRHINVEANSGENNIEKAVQKYTWYDQENSSDYVSTENGQTNENINVNDNYADIQGIMKAGIYANQKVVIDGIVDLNMKDGKTEIINEGVTSKPTITYGEGTKINIETGIEDYGNNLIARYNEVSSLLKDYSDTKSAAYQGYVAERTRILNTMLSLGLAEKKGDTIVPVGKLDVQYVKISDLVASGGNIVINSSNIKNAAKGIEEGRIQANGNPQVSITNNSNLYLKVGDIRILEKGGRISFNNETVKDVSSSENPAVNIINNWNSVLNVKDKEGNTRDVHVLSTIEVTGNIENLIGDINITNNGGDILMQGEKIGDSTSMAAGGNINLTATGSIAQAYAGGITNIGTAPEKAWQDDMQSTKDEVLKDNNLQTEQHENTSRNNGVKNETTSGMAAGGEIYLNGEIININGNIQSGFDKYEVVIKDNTIGYNEETVANLIASYDKKWEKNRPTIGPDNLKDYILTEGGSQYVDGKFYYKPATYYDPSTKQVVVGNINVGGGKVYITGRIISTGNGKIAALDGAANINIDNQTNTALKLGSINNKNVEGLVSITDTQRNITVEYRRDKTTVKDVDGNEISIPEYVKNNIYRPDEGQRYNWTEGTETGTSTKYTQSKDFYLWGGIRMSMDEVIKEGKGDPQDTVVLDSQGKPVGNFITQDKNNKNDFSMKFDNKVDKDSKEIVGEREWTDYHDFLHFSGTDYFEWTEKQSTQQTYTGSIKADRDVKIGFIGSNDGNITINSKNNIELSGSIANAREETGTSITNITSKDGNIIRTGGTITADTINLSGKTGIDNINVNGIGDTVNLTAKATEGNVDITAGGNVVVNEILGKNRVELSANGSISQDPKNATGVGVTASRIDLTSKSGGINLVVNSGNDILAAGDTLSASINASADGDISLKETEGNMRIGKIYSSQGNVTLETTGTIIDALPTGDKVENSSVDEMINRWQEAGLIETEEFREKKVQQYNEYKNGVKKEYQEYLSLKAQDEKDSVEAAKFAKLDEKYGSYDSVDKYLENSKEGKDQLALRDSGGKWNKDQLLYAIQDNMINQTTGSTSKEIKDANIKGKEIKITAKGVGVDKGETVIDLNTLEIDDLKKLSSSEVADVIWDKVNNKATIREKNPIGIQMTSSEGKLDITASDNIYLAARVDRENTSSNNPNVIYVNEIATTDGNIRLLGKDGIYNVSQDGTNFTGKDLILEGGAGSLGTIDNPLTMALSGNLTARTDQDIYLNQTGNMDIVAMYAGGAEESSGTIVLDATGNIYSVNTGTTGSTDGSGEEDENLVLGYLNAAGDIVLTAGEDIGTEKQGVNILNGADAKVDAEAKNIYLTGKKEGALNLGTVIADTNIGITSESGIVTREELKTNLENGTIDLNAKNNILLGGTVSTNNLNIATIEGAVVENKDTNLTANNIIVNALNGINLQGNNKINSIAITNTTNDIIINNIGTKGLVVNVTKENAGNINITNAAGDIKVISDITATGDNSNVTIENTGSIIFAENKNITAGKDVLLSSTSKGSINVNNITAENSITTSTNIGDISITTGTALGTAEITAKTGNVKVNELTGSKISVTTENTAEELRGNIEIGNVTSTTEEILLATNIGDIKVTGTADAGTELSASTKSGAIDINNAVSGSNMSLTTTNGNVKAGTLETLAGNLSASTVNGNISIITGTALGTADITTKVGNVDITNLTADKDVTIKTETEGKITSTGKLTSINESLEVYSAKGDINLNEVYAKDQARVYAKDGDIYIKLINGDYVVITMGSKDHKMDVKEQIVGKGSMLSSNDITISDLSQREGYTTPVEVTFNNSEDNTNSPITRAELHAKGLANGLLITQLWAKDAEISTDGKILQLPKLNITGIGHFANDTTTTTVYGENSGYDNTDISIWNQASLTVPTELQYILLNFTNEPNTIETDGILLKVTDGFKVYAEREAGEEIMLDKLKDFEAEINKSYILNSPFEFVYKPYLNYNLIDNNIENAGMPEIIVTKDKIIISGTKAKEDKEIPIIAVENTEEEEKEKIAQK